MLDDPSDMLNPLAAQGAELELRDRFTARARNAMQTAAEEARRRDDRSIETEHILLGLVAENGGVVATVLHNLGLHPATIALRLETAVPWKNAEPIQGRPPFSRAAKNVVEFAIEEARNMTHTYVGTEHLLIGLARGNRCGR